MQINWKNTPMRVMLLGDSITDDGRYISLSETWLRLYRPDAQITLYNYGLSSETAAGIREAQPYLPPRPCAMQRLKLSLEVCRPNVVVVCYGMNDGVYAPYCEERFRAYQDGIRQIISAVRAATARVVLATSLPFDAFSAVANGTPLYPAQRGDFSYEGAFEAYDSVMETYADWVRIQSAETDGLIDYRAAVWSDIRTRRSADCGYLSGDGVHPNLYGHAAMANSLLRFLLEEPDLDVKSILTKENLPLFALVHRRKRLEQWRDRALTGIVGPVAYVLPPDILEDEHRRALAELNGAMGTM